MANRHVVKRSGCIGTGSIVACRTIRKSRAEIATLSSILMSPNQTIEKTLYKVIKIRMRYEMI